MWLNLSIKNKHQVTRFMVSIQSIFVQLPQGRPGSCLQIPPMCVLECVCTRVSACLLLQLSSYTARYHVVVLSLHFLSKSFENI